MRVLQMGASETHLESKITMRYSSPRLGPDDKRATYIRLTEQGLRPSIETVVAALKECSKRSDQRTGRKIHKDVLETGDISHSYIANSLVNMYAKCGAIDDARRVFESINNRDVVSWTAIILGYAQSGQGEVALRLYQRMRHEGCAPNRVTVLAGLQACARLAEREAGFLLDGKLVKSSCLERVHLIHCQACESGIELDLSVMNSLLDLYAKCGNLRKARDVFDKMKERSVVSWSCLISGYAQAGEGELAFQLYRRMQEEDFEPDSIAFVAALKACLCLCEAEQGEVVLGKFVKLRCLEKVREIHRRGAVIGDQIVANMLIDLYSKCGSMQDARRVFDDMHKNRDVISWNTLIHAYVETGDSESALELFSLMPYEGHDHDRVSILAALKACSRLSQRDHYQHHLHRQKQSSSLLEKLRTIHRRALSKNLVDMVVENTLIDTYANCGSMVDARRVFLDMKQRNVISWNCIITGYAQAGDASAALEHYAEMHQDGACSPNGVTHLAALKACGTLAAFEAGRQIQADIFGSGSQCDAAVATALVDFYAKCGRMVEADQILESMPAKNLVGWTALIAGYSSQGNTDRALKLFERMQSQERIRPDEITYLAILSACRHSGLIDKAKEIFTAMVSKHRLTPKLEHYSCMVDILGRANELEGAVEMVRAMPCKADVVIWMSVLNSSWRWGNLRTGKIAFDAVMELDTRVSAAYTLMSNIYSRSSVLS